jgi:hypothetical protein
MCKTYLYIFKLLHFECAGYRSMVQKFEVETIKIRTNMKAMTARTQNFFFFANSQKVDLKDRSKEECPK